MRKFLQLNQIKNIDARPRPARQTMASVEAYVVSSVASDSIVPFVPSVNFDSVSSVSSGRPQSQVTPSNGPKRTLKIGVCDGAEYMIQYFKNLGSSIWNLPSGSSMTYDVNPSDNPDVLFFSYFGSKHQQYKCPKIFLSGEPDSARDKPCVAIFDCKIMNTLRPGSAKFGYIPFYVISFVERFQNRPSDLIKPFPPVAHSVQFSQPSQLSQPLVSQNPVSRSTSTFKTVELFPIDQFDEKDPVSDFKLVTDVSKDPQGSAHLGELRELSEVKELKKPEEQEEQYDQMSQTLNAQVNDLVNQKTQFCAFLYSHDVGFRNNLFDSLSVYKPVMALGKCKSRLQQTDRRHYQVGKSTYNDLAVQKYRPFKFVIACENQQIPGYITEKIVSAMLAYCIPIYCGASDIANHFNPNSFIYLANPNDSNQVRQMVLKVKELDQNPELYKNMLREPWFKDNQLPQWFSQTYMSNMIRNVLSGINIYPSSSGFSGSSGSGAIKAANFIRHKNRSNIPKVSRVKQSKQSNPKVIVRRNASKVIAKH